MSGLPETHAANARILEGSCLCGAVRFRVSGEFDGFFLCHCARCRKDTGSAHAANMFSSTGKISWLEGTDRIRSFRLPGTRHEKSFCTTCGSALPTVQMDGALLVVPAGSVDSVIDRRPDAHIFHASRADWDACLAEVPQLDGPPG